MYYIATSGLQIYIYLHVSIEITLKYILVSGNADCIYYEFKLYIFL